MPKQKSTRYRLALDLGSTSLGWAVLRLNEQHEPNAIIRAGVRIFSDGRNPKDGSSLAVTRRAARAMRRRRDRLLKRKARMMNKLVEYGFFPADVAERKKLERINPYELRAKGLDAPLTPGEFARALFHINQRRGFKSNRKTDKKENDSGALKAAISHLRQQLHERKARTVGEWLWLRLQAGLGTRARYRESRVAQANGKTRIEKSYDLYVDRQMIAEEFDALWAAQAAFNPQQFSEQARGELRDVLLFQRDLRPVRPGRCTLLPDEERAPLALPSVQRFRILQEANHLRLLHPDLHEEALSLAQRDAVVDALERNSKRTFEQLRKLLKLNSTVKFNLEDEKRKELKGNATSAALSKDGLFGENWWKLDEALQDAIVWQLVSEQSEEKLQNWLQANTGVNATQAETIANAGLPEGYGSLSYKALARIVPALRGAEVVNGIDVPRTYDQAVQAAGFAHHSDLDSGFDFEHSHDEVERIGERVIASTGEVKPVFAFKQLPYYGKALRRHVAFAKEHPRNEEERYGKIANPTVHIGLNQLRVVVNALIRRYGRPTEVVVELARDLKQSREQRQEEQKRQADYQKRNERIRREIASMHGCAEERVSHADVQKWILWEELSFDVADRRCPYSGVQISAQMLLSNQVEIEHILPFSQTLDNSLNNRTVAMRQANRIKGNRTPWQAREDFERQGWSYDSILQRAERMPKAKRYRFSRDGYERWLKEDKDFLARALNDTRYLSRVAKTYMELVCPFGTRVIPGQMTALLRAKFGLNDVLGLNGEKNRNDHRHHAVDACVIGVTDQGLLQRFAQASADARGNGLEKLVENMPVPWATYRDHVKRAIQCIWVSHKPDHGYEGPMMEETAYGIRKDGSIRQKTKADGSTGRAITNLIRIIEPTQKLRHGVDAQGQPLAYKGYVGGSNHCIEITQNAQGKWEGNVITTFQAYDIVRRLGSKQGPRRLRHPTLAQALDAYGKPKKLIMRLMIDDCVRLELDGNKKTLRVVNITGNGQVFMAPVHEANVDKRNSDKTDPFAYVSKYAGSFQKAKARRITISPIGDLHDPGF